MKKKWILFFVVLLIIGFVLVACARNSSDELMPQLLQEPEENTKDYLFAEFIYLPENLTFFTPGDLPTSTRDGYEWIVPPILSRATHFDDRGRAMIWRSETDDRESFIGEITGKAIAMANIGAISHYFDNTVLINRDSKWTAFCLENHTSKTIGQFDSFVPYPELGLISVRIGSWNDNNARAGVIDMTGREVIPLQFWDFIRGISEGLAVAGVRDPDWAANGRWGFADITTGEVVIPQTFGWAHPFSEGFAVVVVGPFCWMYDYKWSFIDTQGKLLVPAIYSAVMDFSEGMAAVRIGNWLDDEPMRWGFIDTMGNEVVPPIYSEVKSFSEGMAAVRIGEWFNDGPIKWGFIDRTGQEVIPLIFEDVGMFANGLAAAQIDGRWGFIDKSGQFVIPPIYTLAWPFYGDFARVYYGGDAIWINPCDGVPTPFGGEWHFLNRRGEMLISLKYTYVGNIQNGKIHVRIGNDEMMYDEERSIYLPMNAGWFGDSWGLIRIELD